MKKEIVMIHGWGVESYTSNLDCGSVGEDVAWNHRKRLVDLLRERYSVRFFNLPGFCCVDEPDDKVFDVENFSESFFEWLRGQKVKPVAILGYSFGGTVALDYKIRYESSVPLILVSPALKRRETIKSKVGGLGKNVVPARYFDALKSLYQYVFSKYYREGTPFLRASYDKISRADSRLLLGMVDSKDILLIYGDSDESTPAEYVTEMILEHNLNCLLIKGGGHNIGGTHPEDISSAVIDFLSKR